MLFARLRGRGRRLDVVLDDEVPFPELQNDLNDLSQRIRDRFPGEAVTVNVGKRVLEVEDMCLLKRVMVEEYGLQIAEVWCYGNVISDVLAERSGLPVKLVSNSHQGGTDDSSKDHPMILRGSCRSGVTIQHEGDVVILGDVNQGARVHAAGDIVVYGVLRGTVHAGSRGDDTASVFALSIQRRGLRIGSLTDQGISHEQVRSEGPEIAYVREGGIVVEPYTPLLHWDSEIAPHVG